VVTVAGSGMYCKYDVLRRILIAPKRVRAKVSTSRCLSRLKRRYHALKTET
jgi:hypothetical protein